MKKILFLLALYAGSFYHSQTNRFTYQLQFRKDVSEGYREIVMNLDISPKSVKFYDKKFAEYDSINKLDRGTTSHYSTRTDQIIERKPDSFKNNWYRDFHDYFIVKTNDEMKWKLFPETQEYNGYKLQKATTDFGGRTWTAWFSNEVNIKEGPYKFRGLPGLIFILEDAEQNFVYKLINNKKLSTDFDTKDFMESHYGKQAIPITNEKFNTYVENLYADPVRIFADGVKNGNKANFKNETVESIEELNSKKAMLQNGIRERYIYIEKDKQPVFNK